MDKKPLILITNDDGINAPGLAALVEAAKDFGTIVISAPDSPQSGQGHAITIKDPLRLKKVKLFEGIEAYECSGTPVDCVKLAKSVILKDQNIDLCLSGINHGPNHSLNILYSGTMSAAMEASLEGINSIGFSLLDFSWKADFDHTIPHIKKLISFVLERGMTNCNLLNVNIPMVSESPIEGFKICRQAEARWVEEYVEGTDPYGQKYYWLTGNFVNGDDGADTDVWALENNYISVVPSGHDLTKYSAFEDFSALEIKSN